jgi:hypothetical protein
MGARKQAPRTSPTDLCTSLGSAQQKHQPDRRYPCPLPIDQLLILIPQDDRVRLCLGEALDISEVLMLLIIVASDSNQKESRPVDVTKQANFFRGLQ